MTEGVVEEERGGEKRRVKLGVKGKGAEKEGRGGTQEKGEEKGV